MRASHMSGGHLRQRRLLKLVGLCNERPIFQLISRIFLKIYRRKKVQQNSIRLCIDFFRNFNLRQENLPSIFYSKVYLTSSSS